MGKFSTKLLPGKLRMAEPRQNLAFSHGKVRDWSGQHRTKTAKFESSLFLTKPATGEQRPCESLPFCIG